MSLNVKAIWKISFQHQSEFSLNQQKISIRFKCCSSFSDRAVIENLVEKQFPAPSRRFVDSQTAKAGKTAKKRKTESPSRDKNRSSGSKRKSTESNARSTREPAQKRRVIFISSDDSDGSDSEKKKKKKKKTAMTDSDSQDDDDIFKGKFHRFLGFVENFDRIKIEIVNFDSLFFSKILSQQEIKWIRQ